MGRICWDKENEAYKVCTSSDDISVTELFVGWRMWWSRTIRFVIEDFGFHYLSVIEWVSMTYAKNMLNDSDFGIDGEYALAYLLQRSVYVS